VPTVKESGLPNYVVTSWNAVSAPAGTPNDIVQFLSKEIREALKSPDIQEKALQFGLDARGTTPEEMQARMRADIEKWAAVIEKAGIARQ
jgi:tripartite-type tricarboxylate transporter receptor subunit TctC